MITVEFKLSLPDGNSPYVSKAINSLEDYEQFKKEVREGIQSLDDLIKHNLIKLNNGKRSDQKADQAVTQHQR